MTTDSGNPHGEAAALGPGAGPIASDEQFSEFFTKSFERFVAWTRKEYGGIARDRQTAEEIVTDAFHKLYEERSQVANNPDSALMARIRSEAVERGRRSKKSQDDAGLDLQMDPSARPADSALGSQECREIFSEEVVATLRGEDRRLYDLFIEDKDYREISSITGIPYESVKEKFKEIHAHLFTVMGRIITLDSSNPPSRAVSSLRTAKAAQEAIGKLPRLLSAVVRLTYVDKLPAQQIAIRLKLASAQEVAMHLGRAMDVLTQRYKAKMPEALMDALNSDLGKKK